MVFILLLNQLKKFIKDRMLKLRAIKFCKAISKPWGYPSYSSGRQIKVHISRKEHYNDDETPYYSKPKPRESWVTNFYAVVQRRNWTMHDVDQWFKRRAMREIIADQRFVPERFLNLGPNLAAAHFITGRGGKVKFVGNDKWYSYADIKKGYIPSIDTPGFYVEEIDATDTPLCYEGFENLYNLRALKKLILRECFLIDDWCLHRTHIFKNSLQFIDVTGCPKVTERGIICLHPLRNLETLVIEDNPNIQNKELVCLLLQELAPKCNVIGVDFEDPVFLKRLENYMT
ncbi:hypothetical protein JTE90_016226 [Oedothorax gibbosus]|uniref:ATP synthase subunit s-like protein n=1 Tax=Oedothorax gibbosus TaxID=931172 RepID=A0AAV6VTQ3_9ARAC|nr:hypothetical protein JTE90_016226 [Oedothorax gibbosus]